VKLAEDIDLEVLARRTPGFVGADLANILNEAALLAARRDKQAVEMVDLEEAVDRTVVGLERKQRVMNPAEKERIAFHEAGHALVALSVEHADPVHRVSIIPRGVAALGYTLQLPTEDRYLMTRQELLDRIAVALGGRAAEALIFGDVSTGAADDLRRVVEMASRMVKEYGMSDRFGAVVFDGLRRTGPFTGDSADGAMACYSDQTAREIDEEISKLIEAAEVRVRDLLSNREPALRATAERLIEREIIEQEELNTIMRDHGLIPASRETGASRSDTRGECPESGASG
jgi:cell division protease FtsH